MENWKDIQGYEGVYEISDLGQIRSVDRLVINPKKGIRRVAGRVLKPSICKGYYYLILCKEGKKKFSQIHILVASHYVPNPENKPEVNHKDGNKLNNAANNVEWCTKLENKIHAIIMGLTPTKLNENDVKDIRRLHKHYTYKSLGKIFGVHCSTIKKIVNRKSWVHIQ